MKRRNFLSAVATAGIATSVFPNTNFMKLNSSKFKISLAQWSLNKAIKSGKLSPLDFAKKALETRFDKKQVKRIKVDLKELLNPTRKEDMGNDVWSVFNVVQEKIIHGGFDYISGTKVRKARRVKNFKQDQKINKELFDLALEYVA